jgi:hypothetical protein
LGTSVAIFPSFSSNRSLSSSHSSARAISMERLCCAASAGLELSRNITRHARRPLIAQRPTTSTHWPRVSVSAGGKEERPSPTHPTAILIVK